LLAPVLCTIFEKALSRLDKRFSGVSNSSAYELIRHLVPLTFCCWSWVRKCHIVLSSYELDEYRSECWYLRYSIWAPRASSYHIPDSFIRVLDTQPDEVKRHEQPRRQTRSRDTYSPSLIKRMFDQRCWCSYFIILFQIL
jgi:hypothetical protein